MELKQTRRRLLESAAIVAAASIVGGWSHGFNAPTPGNSYVAENGLTFYVAEDGLTFYVQEI